MDAIAGWVMIVVSAAVLLAAFPGQYGGGAMLPQFIGSVGLPFGLIFAAFQGAVALRLGKAKVLWLVSGLFLTGAMLGAVGRALDLDRLGAKYGVSYAEYVVCAAACVSGIGLGIAIVRGWVYED